MDIKSNLTNLGSPVGGNSLNKLNPLKLGEKANETNTDKVGETLNGFGSVLKKEMNHINDLQNNASQAVETFSTGGDIELHNVIMSVGKADMAIQLASQVRNRMVSAYQEVARMNI